MEHAWLDSLSEDWISQPRSSGSPTPSLPSFSNSSSSGGRASTSHIPKYNPQKQAWTSVHDGEHTPLSERSFNYNNIPVSQHSVRNPSKLRGVTSGKRGRELSRTASASTSKSAEYHTIQHKSISLSPRKNIQETPEWKRRLIHGDVGYGEQKDLFSAAGLETIFQPPSNPLRSPTKVSALGIGNSSMMIPSSPPPYNLERKIPNLKISEEDADDVNPADHKPAITKYEMVELGSGEFSVDDLSRNSNFQHTVASLEAENMQNLSSTADSYPDSSVGRCEEPISGTNRAVSGQSDIRNEELSPIYVARHNIVNGQVDYAALDLPPQELQRRLQEIQEDSVNQHPASQDENSEALPQNVTIETEDFAHNGQFVNFHRGGLSQEGSFQKRLLSPSSLPPMDESALLPEESMQASTPKQLPNIKKTRASDEHRNADATAPAVVPFTPHPSPVKDSKEKNTATSGSPLKLFGTYDTFTNQKLLRRLSQFEGNYQDNSDNGLFISQEPTRSEVDDAFVAASSPEKISDRNHGHLHSTRDVRSFGEGDLDRFQFSEEISYESSQAHLEDEDKENMALPVLDRTQQAFKFQSHRSPSLNDSIDIQRRTRHTSIRNTSKQVITIRKTSRPDTGSSGVSAALLPSQILENLQTPRKRDGDSQGKRLPKTPLRDPTPKRRRTLHKMEVDYSYIKDDATHQDSLKETHQQMQSVIGRKRKDARHGDDQQAANPKVLAMRQILRPRTPTPSQRSSQTQERGPLLEMSSADEENVKMLQVRKIAKIQAELDFAGSFNVSAALRGSAQSFDDSRKGSVTTQDFLDEAKKIMAGIRGKARSGLTSVEESESDEGNQIYEGDAQEDELEDSYQESTKEPFSRPPSRDGKPVQRLPIKQEDPILLDHLRKYQEVSDMDGVIASSMKSIAMAKEATETAKGLNRAADETVLRASGRLLSQDSLHHSDPPNIRISENPEFQRKRKHSTSSIPVNSEDHGDNEFPSQGSNASSSQSTSRSIPTGSSRGSDSRRVIAPHTVSHLIPEQLAGMVFDRERNMWVKRKPAANENQGDNFLPSDETDDDPFGDIPDLSVDETQEMQRIKAVAAKKDQDARMAQIHKDEDQLNISMSYMKIHDSPHLTASSSGRIARPEPVILSQPSSSEVNPRLTSSENHPTEASEQSPYTSEDLYIRHKVAHREEFEEVIEEVEREISIHEDRVNPASPERRRNITISFSSPLASIIHPSGHNQDECDREQAEDDGSYDGRNIFAGRVDGIQNLSSTSKSSTYRNSSRRQSLASRKFSNRPVSRIDEQDEESYTQDGQARRSISIIVTTPAPSGRAASVVLATPRPVHEIGTLTLTPLSDFTTHQMDDSFGLDVSYVAHNQRYKFDASSKRTLSLSIKDLVEKITEVEPYEPFWEHMKDLELQSKCLANLHKLDEFCEQLEELDVSNNQISQLNGVPKTLRHLRIANNCLTDMAAWGHLTNLQYVDVSNNELESLSAFKSLVHLRGLRADNNKIESLDGISQLDGLLSLRLRGNLISTVDFDDMKLQRLTDLDLKENRVRHIYNIQELRSLSTLNLEDNDLPEFIMPKDEVLGTLKYLKLSGNHLESIDVSQFPNLRLLYLDRNRLGRVMGLLKTKYLDSLSMREQSGTGVDQSFLSEAFEIRKLFLSGNHLGTFDPQANFLNLQYLELASCGIESLPSHFGQMFMNIRVLNLNFNAIRDIQPLLGIIRLKKLHLAGNRLARLRMTTTVLAQFPSLTLVDMRHNPLTLGFYPHFVETRMVRHGDDAGEEFELQDPFTLARSDTEKDNKYVACLDMETRMLRRVYEMLVLHGCARLKLLDGLCVDISSLDIRDKVWDALVNAGILSELQAGSQSVEEQQDIDSLEAETSINKTTNITEERWQGEDSFA